MNALATVLLIACFVACVTWSAYARLSDPNDAASLSVRHAPSIDTSRLRAFRDVDRVSYDSCLVAMSEFSRLFQTTFLSETDIRECVIRMHECRVRTTRELHSLRMFLANDATLERALVQRIEEIDAAMAWSLSNVASRYPTIRLLYSSGLRTDAMDVRGADDTWR